MNIIRIPWSWPMFSEASYYGYRWGFAVGPWLVFVGRVKP